MLSPAGYLILILLGTLVGFGFAYWYGRRTKKFKWSQYIALISVPVLGSFSLVFFYGVGVIYFFFMSSVAGFALEHMFGKIYHLALNERLWTYEKFTVRGDYTSLLVLPMWGVAGVVFWLISKSVG